MSPYAPLFVALSKALYAGGLFLYAGLLHIGTVSSQTPRPVTDINKVKAPENSSPSPSRYHGNSYREDNHFVQIGPFAYCSARSATTGYELYSTLGIRAGGNLVMDINPGTASSSPKTLTKVGNKIYFSADDGKNGRELWVTDGKKTGTRMVADLYAGSSSSYPRYICPLGNSGKVIFQASTPTARYELYISDGSATGTKLLKDIYAGSISGNPSYMRTFHNGKKDIVVFYARDASNGAEVWATDGTAAGTVMLKDIYPGTGGSRPRYFQVLGKTVIFQAYNSTQSLDLWVTDGTAPGTKLIKRISRVSPYGIGLYNGVSLLGKYYFEGDDGKTGTECWVTDGTTAGTGLVSDSNPGVGDGYFKQGVALGVHILYSGYGRGQGYEPWILNTITKKATLLKDITAGSLSSAPMQFEVIGKQAVFAAVSPGTGLELHITDGTAAGTKLLKDIYPGPAYSYPFYFTRLATGRIIFRANNRESRYSTDLWVTDGTSKGTQEIPVDWKNAPTASSNPAYATEVNGQLYFAANDGVNGTELWRTNGAATGTALVADIFPGSNATGTPNSSSPRFLVRAGNHLLFAADDGKGKGRELWTSDGTAVGTKILKDLIIGRSSSDPQNLARVGNRVFFNAYGYDNAKPRKLVGRELFSTDGTAAGTKLLKDIYPGSVSSYANGFTEIGTTGKFVFMAFGVTSTSPFSRVGYELYISDGSAAGTKLLMDIYSGGYSGSPGGFTAMGGKVYFRARTSKNGTELWVTDGTPKGTHMVKDLVPGYGSSYPRYLQAVGNKIYFKAYAETKTAYFGAELWESDGTAAGTKLLKDLLPGSSGASPSYITAAGSRHLWFSAYTGIGSTSKGSELWTSDLTSAGTRLHTDIQPGLYSSSPRGFYHGNRSFAVVGSKVFFTAMSPASGRELWLVDNGATATPFGDACKSSHMTGTDPVLGGTARVAGKTKIGFSANVVLLGIRSAALLPVGGECRLHLNPLGPILIVGTSTGTSYTAALPIPNFPRLNGLQMALQTIHLGSSFPAGSGFSNGLNWVIGK